MDLTSVFGASRSKFIRVVDVAVLVASLFLLTYYLDTAPIRQWDEAIYANNAVEMAVHGKPGRLLNNGAPNYFNNKPPFGTWLQALSINFLGIRPMAVRLPSLLAAFGTVLLVFSMGKHLFRSNLVSWLGSLILVLSPGFLRDHVARTGDLDAMLVFCTTALVVCVLYLFANPKPGSRWYWGSSLIFLAGFFIKSVAVCLVLPACLVLVMVSGAWRHVFANWRLYASGAGVLLFIALYFLIAGTIDPLAAEKFLGSDISRSVKNIMPWHAKGTFFYLDNLYSRSFFMPFLYLLPVCLAALAIPMERTVQKYLVGALLFALVFEATIAIPSVKLEWYDAPVYPWLALAVAATVQIFAKFIHGKQRDISTLILIGIFAGTSWIYIQRLGEIKAQANIVSPLELPGRCLDRLHAENAILGDLGVLMQVPVSAHYHQLNFYRKKLLYENGVRVDLYPYLQKLRTGDTVLVCQQEKMDSISGTFSTTLLETCRTCQLLVIEDRH